MAGPATVVFRRKCMHNILTAIRACSRPTSRSRYRVAHLIILSVSLSPVVTAAQRTGQPELRLGIGTFLSRDRGWNYGEPIELFAGVTQRLGSIDVEAGASFSKSFVKFAKPMIDPPQPTGYLDGVRARLGLRAPSGAHSAVSALVGAELVHNRTEGEARTTTAAGTAGIGVNFGSEGRGTVDLRYVRFAKRLGSSRGILPLTLAWRL